MEMETVLAATQDDPVSLLSGYSLEMTANGVPALRKAAHAIPAGTAISVTFLPNEDYAARLQAAQEVRRLGFVPVPHLSARRITAEADLEHFLAALADTAQVDRVFVVGGDPARSMGPYADALSLIRSGILARHGIRQAGIAGYPEGHPDIPAAQLARAMDDKLDALQAQGIAAFIATQFGFEAQPIVRWLSGLRNHGVQCPIHVGVPGPAKLSTLMRYAAQCGVGASSRVMGRYGLSITRLINTVGPTTLIADLARGLADESAADVVLHFYAFGGFQNTAEWIRSFQEAQHG